MYLIVRCLLPWLVGLLLPPAVLADKLPAGALPLPALKHYSLPASGDPQADKKRSGAKASDRSMPAAAKSVQGISRSGVSTPSATPAVKPETPSDTRKLLRVPSLSTSGPQRESKPIPGLPGKAVPLLKLPVVAPKKPGAKPTVTLPKPVSSKREARKFPVVPKLPGLALPQSKSGRLPTPGASVGIPEKKNLLRVVPKVPLGGEGVGQPRDAQPVSGTDRPRSGGFAAGAVGGALGEEILQRAADSVRPAITGVEGPAWHAAGACVDAAVLNAPQGRTVLTLRGHNLTGPDRRVSITHGAFPGVTRAAPLDVELDWTDDRIGLRPRPGLGFEPSLGPQAHDQRFVLVRLLNGSGRTLARRLMPTCVGRTELEILVEAPPHCRAPRIGNLVLTGTYVTPNGERKRIASRRGSALRPANVRTERIGEVNRLRAEGIELTLPRESAFTRGPVTLKAVYDSDCFRGEGSVEVRGLERGDYRKTLVVAGRDRPRSQPVAGGFRIAGVEFDATDHRGRWSLRVRVARPEGRSVWPRDLRLEVARTGTTTPYVSVPVYRENVLVPYYLLPREGHVPLVDGGWVRSLDVRLVRGGRIEDRSTVERSAPPTLDYQLKVTRILAHESGDDDWNEPAPYAEWSAGRIDIEDGLGRIFAYQQGEIQVRGLRERAVSDNDLVVLDSDELWFSGSILPRTGRIPLRIRIWEDDSPLRPSVWSMRLQANVADVCFGPRQARSGERVFTRYLRRRSGGLDLELTVVERCRLPVDGRR